MKGYAKGIYQPLDNQKELREGLKAYAGLEIDQAVIVDTYIQIVRAKTSKLEYPTAKSIHGDDDNLRKAISDGLIHRKILTDDSKILGGEIFKFFGTEPLTVIKIWSVSANTKSIEYGL